MWVSERCIRSGIGGILLASVAAGADAGPEADPVDLPSGVPAELVGLAQGVGNLLPPFTPRLRAEKGTERSPWRARHTPILVLSTPWTEGGVFFLEVPEYVWGRTASDRRPGPLYYGRSLKQALSHGIKDWVIRFPSQETPVWRSCISGALALDNPLDGGITVRFRVVPHDRILEVRVGITNRRAEPITGVRTQLCVMSHREPVLAERHPTSSWLLSDGKAITWTAAGQDLGWLEEHRVPGTDRFTQSCYLMASVGSGPTPGRLQGVRLQLARHIDVPAIAKADSERRRALVVYSPDSTGVFYNVLVPCFHADPRMGDVPAGETRWTRSYYLFFEGDLETFLRGLARIHETLGGQGKGG